LTDPCLQRNGLKPAGEAALILGMHKGIFSGAGLLAMVFLPAAFPAVSLAQTRTNRIEPASPQALPEAAAILNYLCNLPYRQDRKLISGQFESWGNDVKPLSNPSNQLAIVYQQTGKWVGLVGVEYHAGGVFPDAPNQLCIDYWRKGGLVQIYLIMRNPAAPDSRNGGGRCDINLVLDREHAYHRFFFKELDEVAAGLATLRDNGVIVFLNPFAEMSADWFWWGGQSPQKFRALYQATFDYLVMTKKLNNLLFIFEPCNGHKNVTAYYPGDRYVDIVGISCFVSWDQPLTAAQIPAYASLRKLGKPMALSQWGPRRGADQVGRDEPPADNLKLLWGVQNHLSQITWWMNWNMAYALCSPENSNTHAKELLNHPRIVNREDLDWKPKP
jgi:mannan endo-1,4-beta-mannosidase